MPLVDKRYAEALINLAADHNSIDTYHDEFASVNDIFNTEVELRAFLSSPKNSVEMKKNALTAIFETKIQKDLLNLLFLLLDKGRISRLQGIYSEFVRMADDRRNILNITIKTAIPIDETQIHTIGEKFRMLYHSSSVKTTVVVDPALVGGVKVAIGDKLYDGSISGKLSRLKSILT